jgi:hypothetical protein
MRAAAALLCCAGGTCTVQQTQLMLVNTLNCSTGVSRCTPFILCTTARHQNCSCLHLSATGATANACCNTARCLHSREQTNSVLQAAAAAHLGPPGMYSCSAEARCNTAVQQDVYTDVHRQYPASPSRSCCAPRSSWHVLVQRRVAAALPAQPHKVVQPCPHQLQQDVVKCAVGVAGHQHRCA